MTSSDEDVHLMELHDSSARPFRFSIRSLMVLVLLAGIVAWAIRYVDFVYLQENWPVLAILAVGLIGMIWSILRICKNPPARQTLSIVGLIGSLLLIFPGSIAVWFVLKSPFK